MRFVHRRVFDSVESAYVDSRSELTQTAEEATTSRKAKESDGNLHHQNRSNDLEEETIDNFNEDFDEYDDDEDLPEGDVELQRLTPPSSPKSSNSRFKSSSNQGVWQRKRRRERVEHQFRFRNDSERQSPSRESRRQHQFDENNNDNGVTTTTTTTTSPLPITTTTLRRNPSSFERLSTTISESYRKSKQVVKGFVNVNMCASISGLILGIIPFTRHLFFDTEGALYFVYRALYSMGQAAVPQVLVIIGATLANGPDHSFAPKRTAVGVLSVRFLLLLSSTSASISSSKSSTVPLYRLRVAPTTPSGSSSSSKDAHQPASNMVLQTMMYSKEPEKAAAGVASLLFWQYLSAPFLLTGFICLFLSII